MRFDADTLYRLLPAVYRVRDAENGGALAELVRVMAEQIAAVEDDIDQLYDDQFIETCAQWVVPYIGDLIGHRAIGGGDTALSRPRAEVANTIGYRRRKGTLGMLEQLARDATGLEAHAVEFFQRLATTQFVNHVRPGNVVTASVRNADALELVDGPFEPLTRNVDVRRIASGRGRHNLPNVGIFIWRLRAHNVSASDAAAVDARRFFFSPLGHNMPLFNRPRPQGSMAELARPEHVPGPMSRRFLRRRFDDEYGVDGSVLVTVGDSPVPRDQVSVCNLSDADADPETSAWTHMPATGIAIDPVLGRIAFSADVDPAATPVRVFYQHGFTAGANIGGGEYGRAASLSVELEPRLLVPQDHAQVDAALTALGGAGAVQIGDNLTRPAPATIVATADSRLEIRGADEARPVLIAAAGIDIGGDAGAEVTLNGLWITGGPIRVPAMIGGEPNRLQRLRLRHCTLVPGLALTRAGAPRSPQAPSLVIEAPTVEVIIERSIVGAIRAVAEASCSIAESIVDATDPQHDAYRAADGSGDTPAGAPLTIVASTIVGKVWAAALPFVSNSILLAERGAADAAWPGPVVANRRQQGCVRFSYVPLSAIVPRRYRCQPVSQAESDRVRPAFASLRYGDPAYGVLTELTPHEILRGADDESELGAFHHLQFPKREADLRVRLEEFLPFGLEVGLCVVR